MIESGRDPAAADAQVRIIIPAHNEAARLHETVVRLGTYFGNRATLLVVANGCTDDTASVVRILARRFSTVELLEIPAKIGKGGAVRAGLTMGTEPYVAFVDADGSTAADQLDVLLQTCKERKLAGTIGSRWMRDSRIARKQPLQRRIASRVFNFLTRIAFGLNFTDTQCGAKVFERAAIDEVLDKLEIANFAFDVDVLLELKKIGKPVIELPISWEDVVDFSKVRLVRSGPPMLWALLRLYLRESIFHSLPFVDALGRSETIPVRKKLDVLFLVSKGPAEDRALGELIEGLRKRGHTARLVPLRDIASVLEFGLWYVRRGHRQSDVIVQALGGLQARLLGFSVKPKFSLADVTRSAKGGDRCAESFIESAMRAIHSPLHFRRSDDGWNLAAQRLENSSVEPT